jgi:hypothetical protein
MSECEVCGNEYDKSFELITAGARHTFTHSTASNAPFKRLRSFASTVSAKLLDTA